jgi:hypothetical protein
MRRREAALRLLTAPALGLGVFALGCAADVVGDQETAQSEVTHAVVVVERSADADEPETVKAEAFAGFLSLPADLEPNAVLPIAGLTLDLPAAGACKDADDDSAPVPAVGLARAELVDAGEVTLVAGGVVTTLAPRAFPSAADGISGVVYTTRDRAAEPLPAASRYTVATSGSAALEPISVDLPAPAALAGVTVMGEPLSNGATIAGAHALELRWNAGAAGDIVYATLETDDSTTLCSFRDDGGRGALPASALPRAGSASLSVHRLRTTSFASVGLGRGELRFDFEVSGSVTVE